MVNTCAGDRVPVGPGGPRKPSFQEAPGMGREGQSPPTEGIDSRSWGLRQTCTGCSPEPLLSSETLARGSAQSVPPSVRQREARAAGSRTPCQGGPHRYRWNPLVWNQRRQSGWVERVGAGTFTGGPSEAPKGHQQALGLGSRGGGQYLCWPQGRRRLGLATWVVPLPRTEERGNG